MGHTGQENRCSIPGQRSDMILEMRERARCYRLHYKIPDITMQMNCAMQLTLGRHISCMYATHTAVILS